MFLLFGIFVSVIAAVLFPLLTSSVLVSMLVAIPTVLRELPQVFWTFKRGVIWLKRSFRYRKELLICSNLMLFFFINHHQNKFWVSRYIHFFSVHGIDCLDNMQYDHTYFAQCQYSLDLVVLVNLCNHEPLCLIFYLGW